MTLFFDLDLGRFVSAPGFRDRLRNIEFKRGDAALITLGFYRGITQVILTGTPQLTLAIKEAGKYDGDPLVSTSTWTLGTTEAKNYSCSPNFNTAALNALLMVDEDEDNDPASITAMLEVTWTEDSGTTWTSSDTIAAKIHNDVIRGDEGTPVELPTPESWLYARQAALTFAGADPNVPEEITITGTLTDEDSAPAVFPVLVRAGDINGRPSWSNDGEVSGSTHWVSYSLVASAWALSMSTPASSWLGDAGDVDSPLIAGEWVPQGANTGTPLLAGDAPAATHLGQWCRVETADANVYDWWQWNGDEWVFVRTDDVSPVTAINVAAVLPAAITEAGPAEVRAGLALNSRHYGSNLQAAFQAIEAALTAGRSAEIVVLGDSTGNEDEEWFELFGAYLAARHPTVRHVKRIINTTTNVWTETVPQAADGERYLSFPASNGSVWNHSPGAAPHPTGAFTVEGKIRVANFTENNAKSLCGHWPSTSTDRVWDLRLLTAGTVQFRFYDSTNTVRTISGSTPFAAGAGADFWFRVEFTPDNGSSQAQIDIYESADGVTWTTPLQTVTLAGGPFTLQTPATAPPLIVGLAGVMPLNVRVYHVYTREADSGAMTSPFFIDHLFGSGTSTDHTFEGSPTLLTSNYSRSGNTIANLQTNIGLYGDALFVRANPCVFFINVGHNETYAGNTTGPQEGFVTGGLDWFVSTYQAYSPKARPVFIAQNPKDKDAYQDGMHATRITAGLGWAHENGYGAVNFYQAIMDSGLSLSETVPDGLHPSDYANSDIMFPIIRANYEP